MVVITNSLCVINKIDWWLLKLGVPSDSEMDFLNVVCIFYSLQRPASSFPIFFSPEHSRPCNVDLKLLPALHSASSVYIVGTEWIMFSLFLTSLTSVVVQISSKRSPPLEAFPDSPRSSPWPLPKPRMDHSVALFLLNNPSSPQPSRCVQAGI